MDTVLYPPSLYDYESAFIKDENIKIHFRLSEFTTISSIQSVHVLITKVGTNQNLQRTEDVTNRYKSNGSVVILNRNTENLEQDIVKEDEEGKYIILTPYDLKMSLGTIYKIQLRIATVKYDPSSGLSQTTWLNINSDNFSEWSQPTITKCIGESSIVSPMLDWGTTPQQIDTLNLVARYTNEDPSELLYSYNVSCNGEKSGEIIVSNFNDSSNQSEIKYDFRNSFTGGSYFVTIEYTTINKYKGVFLIPFVVADSTSVETRFKIYTTENNIDELGEFKTISQEEDCGGIDILIYDSLQQNFTGTIVLSRSSYETNFSKWDDIISFTFDGEVISRYYKDNTFESDIYYKYRIQEIQANNRRSIADVTPTPIKRSLEYAFLSGENGRQIKLTYDLTVSSMSYNIEDTVMNTIGSKYPYIVRNSPTGHKTFPLNGLISFQMDEFFINDSELFGAETPQELRADKRAYNAFRERKFRDGVLSFLQDGKAKLFRTATEGNLIIRLTNVQTSPNQTLSRLIYNFSSDAIEIDDNTIENYKNYNFFRNFASSEIVDLNTEEHLEHGGAVVYGVMPLAYYSTHLDELQEVLEKHYNGEIDLTEYWKIGDILTDVQSGYNTNKYSFVIVDTKHDILAADGTTRAAISLAMIKTPNSSSHPGTFYYNSWSNSSDPDYTKYSLSNIYSYLSDNGNFERNCIPAPLARLVKPVVKTVPYATDQIGGYDTEELTVKYFVPSYWELYNGGDPTYDYANLYPRDGEFYPYFSTDVRRRLGMTGNYLATRTAYWKRQDRGYYYSFYCAGTSNPLRPSGYDSYYTYLPVMFNI